MLMKNNFLQYVYDRSQKGQSLITTCISEGLHISRLALGLQSRTVFGDSHVTTNKESVINKLFEIFEQMGIVAVEQTAGLNCIIYAYKEDGEIPLYVAHFTIDNDVISYSMDGDLHAIKEFQTILDNEFSIKPVRIYTCKEFDKRDGRLINSLNYLKETDENLSRQCFYPWLGVTLEEYFSAFMDSPESILLLIGPPGTGKSTFLRTLIAHVKKTALICYNKEVIESPRTISAFMECDASLLIYEDMDRFIGAREDGNELMSTILNAAEGIIKRPGKKIIFSTNLSDINKIDPALLRVGRCFDILKFETLSAEEAQVVNTELNYPERDFTTKHSWTLAEVLAKSVPAQQTVNRFAKRIGF